MFALERSGVISLISGPHLLGQRVNDSPGNSKGQKLDLNTCLCTVLETAHRRQQVGKGIEQGVEHSPVVMTIQIIDTQLETSR